MEERTLKNLNKTHNTDHRMYDREYGRDENP